MSPWSKPPFLPYLSFLFSLLFPFLCSFHRFHPPDHYRWHRALQAPPCGWVEAPATVNFGAFCTSIWKRAKKIQIMYDGVWHIWHISKGVVLQVNLVLEYTNSPLPLTSKKTFPPVLAWSLCSKDYVMSCRSCLWRAGKLCEVAVTVCSGICWAGLILLLLLHGLTNRWLAVIRITRHCTVTNHPSITDELVSCSTRHLSEELREWLPAMCVQP